MRTKAIKNKINVITLGCSKNIYDSEVLISHLKNGGKDVSSEKDGNIVVINTCGFINKAKEESINTILKNVRRKQIGEIDKVFVTGCLSERYKEDLIKNIPEVDQYFGTNDLPQLLERLKVDYKYSLLGEKQRITPRHYSYLKISEGCDRPCSFCAIPLMRGSHKSKTIEELIFEAKNLAQNGVKEIILIAQDLTYYGIDIYKRRVLDVLLSKLCQVDGIEWIRLHYAFPTGFPEEILDVMSKEKKICKYLDMPIQHISNHILKSMKRGASKEKINDLIKKIRDKVPGIALRTTVMVGYPGEKEEDFIELKDWLQETRFERLGCFTYSHEENTSAFALIDDVSEAEKEKRAGEIMSQQAEISLNMNNKKIDKIFKCMVDRVEGKNFICRTEMDSPDVDNEILVDASKFYLRLGDFCKIKIMKVNEFDLFGEPVSS